MPPGIGVNAQDIDQSIAEFGSAANAHDVAMAMQALIDLIDSKKIVGMGERDIVEVVHDTSHVQRLDVLLTECQLQIIRFSLERAMETI